MRKWEMLSNFLYVLGIGRALRCVWLEEDKIEHVVRRKIYQRQHLSSLRSTFKVCYMIFISRLTMSQNKKLKV